MLILFMGPTASGKTSLMNSICEKSPDVCVPVVRTTTREKRDTETDGKDYKFISVGEFNGLLDSGLMIEHEEYSGGRLYGTEIGALNTGKCISCSTITPSGLLQLCSSGVSFGNIMVIYCHCSLANQIIRYVNRKKDFGIEDKLEMCDRLARDEGMFKGIESVISAAKTCYMYHGHFEYHMVDTDPDFNSVLKSVMKILNPVIYVHRMEN